MRLLPGQPVTALRNDAVSEKSQLTALADAGVYEVQSVTCAAFASTAQGDYFIITNKAGNTWGVWLDKDANGTEPSQAIYTALDHKIQVAIVTGDTAAQVATKVLAAVGSNITNVTTASGGAGVVTFTSTKLGNVAAPARHNAAENANGSFVVATDTGGVASSLQNKYFTLHDGADAAFYGWLNIGSEGSDPSQSGTAVPIAAAGGATATAVATAIAAAIEALAGFKAWSSGAAVYVQNNVTGESTDIGAGNSGFTVGNLEQGATDSTAEGAATATSSLSNYPSIVT